MEKVNECPNCGATFGNDEKACKYCGTINPNYVPKKEFGKAGSIFESFKQGVNQNSSVNKYAPKKGFNVSNINWFIAVLLFIFVWPIGIIYILVKGFGD